MVSPLTVTLSQGETGLEPLWHVPCGPLGAEYGSGLEAGDGRLAWRSTESCAGGARARSGLAGGARAAPRGRPERRGRVRDRRLARARAADRARAGTSRL